MAKRVPPALLALALSAPPCVHAKGPLDFDSAPDYEAQFMAICPKLPGAPRPCKDPELRALFIQYQSGVSISDQAAAKRLFAAIPHGYLREPGELDPPYYRTYYDAVHPPSSPPDTGPAPAARQDPQTWTVTAKTPPPQEAPAANPGAATPPASPQPGQPGPGGTEPTPSAQFQPASTGPDTVAEQRGRAREDTDSNARTLNETTAQREKAGDLLAFSLDSKAPLATEPPPSAFPAAPPPRKGAKTGPEPQAAYPDPARPVTKEELLLAANTFPEPYKALGLTVGSGPDRKPEVLRRDGSPASGPELAQLRRLIAAEPRTLARRPDFFQVLPRPRFQELKQQYQDKPGIRETHFKHVELTPERRDFLWSKSCSKVSGDCNPHAKKAAYEKGQFVPPEDLAAIWKSVVKASSDYDRRLAAQAARDKLGRKLAGNTLFAWLRGRLGGLFSGGREAGAAQEEAGEGVLIGTGGPARAGPGGPSVRQRPSRAAARAGMSRAAAEGGEASRDFFGESLRIAALLSIVALFFLYRRRPARP